MKPRQQAEDPWRYASFDGVERLQFHQTAKMTLSERLAALDEMIRVAASLKDLPSAVREDPAAYGDDAGK